MAITLTLQEGVWVNVSSLASLSEGGSYLLSSPNKPVTVVQSSTVPDNSVVGVILNNWQPSVVLKETSGETIYAKSSVGLAYLSVVPAVAGSGGGGGGGGSTVSQFVKISGTSLTAAPNTNYIYEDAVQTTLDIDIGGLSENTSFYVMTSTEVTISVNGLDPTLVYANSYVRIFKNSLFDNGFTIVS